MKNFECKCCGKKFNEMFYVKDENLMPLYYKHELLNPIVDWSLYVNGSKTITCYCSPTCSNAGYVKN